MSGKHISIILVSIFILLAVIFLNILFTGDTAFRIELLKEAAQTIHQLILISMMMHLITSSFAHTLERRLRKSNV